MQTLAFKEKSKQHKIASETINVYVPIADRLGLYAVKSELEDLSFRFLNPDAYQNIEKLFEQHHERLTRLHREAKERITRILEPTHLEYTLLSRQKSPYSTNQKIEKKRIPFATDLHEKNIVRLKECIMRAKANGEAAEIVKN